MEQLQKWLDTLVRIPVAKGWKRSLMDITGVTHHENMWSDIYMFFFNKQEEHRLDDLFIRSLEQVAQIPHRFLDECKISREYVVQDNKRIDLLLADKRTHRAVIIENKVFHTLDNDLNLYWNSIRSKGYKEIKIIVLGLTRYNLTGRVTTSAIDTTDLISITHLDLLEKVMENLPSYLANAEPHHIYLLQEFYKNIQNLTNMIDPQVLSFFCHDGNQEKIVGIHDAYKHVSNYIVKVMECGNGSMLKNSIEALGLRVKAERYYVKYIFTDREAEGQMMLTVFYRKSILRPQEGRQPHIYVVLEIQGKILEEVKKHPETYREILSHFTDKGVKPTEAQGNNWWHYAGAVIPLTDLETDLPRLADLVSSYLHSEYSLVQLGRRILKEIKK